MAAQTVSGKIGGSLSFIELDETLPVGTATPVVPNFLAPSWSYVNGASAIANGINQWWEPPSSPITLAGSATVTYVLTSLTDSLGRAVSFVGGVRGFAILVTSRTAGDYLTVGAAASGPWTSWLVGTTPAVIVWDFFAMMVQQTDKYVVASSTNEQLKIVNSGSHNITFTLLLFGCLT